MEELETVFGALLRERQPQLFLSLLTESEKVMIARRVQIAKRLLAGEMQQSIRFDLGVGQATVEAVERWLKEQCSDYKQVFPKVLEQLVDEEKKEIRRKAPLESGSFRELRRRFPLHFLLLNLLLDDLDLGPKKKRRSGVRSDSYTAPSSQEARAAAEAL
jgi:Trp operon repressor